MPHELCNYVLKLKGFTISMDKLYFFLQKFNTSVQKVLKVSLLNFTACY